VVKKRKEDTGYGRFPYHLRAMRKGGKRKGKRRKKKRILKGGKKEGRRDLIRLLYLRRESKNSHYPLKERREEKGGEKETIFEKKGGKR